MCLLKDVMNITLDLDQVLHKRIFVLLRLLVGCGWSWESNWSQEVESHNKDQKEKCLEEEKLCCNYVAKYAGIDPIICSIDGRGREDKPILMYTILFCPSVYGLNVVENQCWQLKGFHEDFPNHWEIWSNDKKCWSMAIQNGPKHARRYPSPIGSWQRSVQPKLHVGRFVLATIWTTLDVIFDFFPHGRPKEAPLQVQHNFLHTKMSSMGWRMGLLDKQKASWSSWNTQLI